MRKYLLVSSLFVAAASNGVEIGSLTINANHAGALGNIDNTVSTFNPAASGIVRRVEFSGTVTNMAGGWLLDASVLPSGAALASPQPGFAYSLNGQTFTTANVSGTMYAPGGFAASPALTFEHADAVDNGAGADESASITYRFFDDYGPNYAEFSGNITTSDPTYRRFFMSSGSPALSGNGTAVRYDVQRFQVQTSGAYTISHNAGFDSFLNLYQTDFNPASPLTNAVNASDEGLQMFRGSQFGTIPSGEQSSGTGLLNNITLSAGVDYFLVTTMFANGTALWNGGMYTNLVTGPGEVYVPEPMTITSLMLLIALRRKHR
jgi:hypothetical protein